MCGIAGFVNMQKNWRENIERMNQRMIHRGPDSEGVWANEDATVVLGHRRLSILDLSPSGSQPMISASGRYVIAINGEIYNYKGIAERLLKEHKVSVLRGTSDTEVFLEACEAYGFENTLKMAKGMFAVAVYDRKERELFLARDRVGEKPMYYGFLDGRFVFASEIGVIRENSYFKEELDRDALTLYFGFGYIPSPYTVYKNIKKLEAGSVLNIKFPFREIRCHKYWDIMDVAQKGQDNLFQGTEEEAADQLECLLKESVRGEMVADVPIGAFLSGGVDSTVTVAIMQSLADKPIKTFTIGLEEKAFNEAVYAKETAKYLGTDHTELYISDKEAQAVIPKLAYMYGEPFADSSQIPTYLVSKLARETVAVSLSGDGGDELFGGYNIYSTVEGIWKKIYNIPWLVRKMSNGILKHIPWPYYQEVIGRYFLEKSPEDIYEMMGSPKGILDGLVNGGEIPKYKYNSYPRFYLKDSIHNIMLMDLLMYHPDDILTKVDRASMAVSLESRVPLLDWNLIEFAWRLPLKYKYSQGIGKRILKNVLYRYVPEKMMERPKTGFSVPIAEWIRNGNLREWAEDLLNESYMKKQGILNEKMVGSIWKSFLEEGKNESRIWYIFMFEEWYRLNH